MTKPTKHKPLLLMTQDEVDELKAIKRKYSSVYRELKSTTKTKHYRQWCSHRED